MIERIFTRSPVDGSTHDHQAARVVAGAGIQGDRYFDKHDEPGQNVTLVEAEEIEAFIAAHGLARDLSITGRNLVTRGVRLNELVGREFSVGTLRLRGVELCEPCLGLGQSLATGELTPAGVVKAVVHRAGLRADALCTASIAVGDAVPQRAIYPLLRAFHQVPGHEATHLRIARESRATCWNVLLAGRSDLVIGGPDPWPDVDGFHTQALGEVELALVVPHTHPLADAPEPLPADASAPYPLVRQATSSSGEGAECVSDELLTVDTYESQIEAIRHGLGIGYVPAHLVHDDVAAGRLVSKVVTDAPRLHLAVAWPSARIGFALEWFLERLRERDVRESLISSTRSAPTLAPEPSVATI